MLNALLFQAGYNATVVGLGAALLGLAAGAVGAFLYLRRRALAPDAMAHATLPGVGLAFLLMAALGGDGRNLPGLLTGAALTAGLGIAAVGWLARRRLAEDAAIAAVSSCFYGAGIVVLTVIQSAQSGRPAGLEGFLLGRTAGMLRADALLIGAGALGVLAALLLLRRPLAMVAFDAGHAQGLGIRPARMDAALMALVLAVVLAGLPVVGAILVVALLVIPAAAARFWTRRVGPMAALSAAIGGAAGWIGAAASASAPDLPTGPVIVCLCAAAFAISALFAPGRGALAQIFARMRARRQFARKMKIISYSTDIKKLMANSASPPKAPSHDL